jgi:hypothetical protein
VWARIGIVLLLALSSAWSGAAPASAYGNDLAGHPVASLGPPGARALVLFFIASDCPVSNRYFPEMERLRHAFTSQGVAFYYVYPNLTETAGSIHAHQAAFAAGAASLPTLTDPRQELARLTGARTTPEAAILVPAPSGLHTVYAGRIDNRYLSIGQERPSATRHDLEEAITAVLAHRPVPAPGGPPVGCAIVNTR